MSAFITGYGTTIENWQTLQAKINQHPNVVSTSPYIQKSAEEFEDTKGVISIRISKKNRQNNG
jgi:ABC-type lipoprotein release transport system permease subunit